MDVFSISAFFSILSTEVIMSLEFFPPSFTSSIIRSTINWNSWRKFSSSVSMESSFPFVYTGMPRWSSMSFRFVSFVPQTQVKTSWSGTTIIYSEFKSVNCKVHRLLSQEKQLDFTFLPI